MRTGKPCAIVGQSGGPTSAINAILAGIIEGAVNSQEISCLYGMKNGIEGLLREDIVRLDERFRADMGGLDLLEITPSALLGSCRFPLPKELDGDGEKIYERIFEILEKYNIGYFYYIGGNDSMDTVDKLDRYAKAKGIRVSFIGLPKTIDNDLCLTDHASGYGSASKYVATATMEIARDVMSYRLPAVTIVEVMGRDTGWLGCACGLPKALYGTGCDLVYLPEGGFSLDSFLMKAQEIMRKKSWVLCGVCEGISLQGSDDGGVRDAFGHKYLSGIGKFLENTVRRELGCKARSIELNLPQRCSGHIVSKTDIDESRLVGRRAVELSPTGISGVMLGYVRQEGEYGVVIDAFPASEIANRIKCVPDSFIGDGFITKECVEYLYPLIQGEKEIKYKGGLPVHYEL